MTLHPNAKTTPYARRLQAGRVLEFGWCIEDAAQAAGVSVRTGRAGSGGFAPRARPGSRTGDLRRAGSAVTATAFLRRLVRSYRRRGLCIQAILTDNGSWYVSRELEATCREIGIRHYFTKPYRPRTNGKAERFIHTPLRGWVYARPYQTLNQRSKALTPWLRYDNTERPHTALGHEAPVARIRRSK